MHSKKTVLIVDLMNAANMELIRLDFAGFATIVRKMEFKLMMQKPDRGTSGLVLG